MKRVPTLAHDPFPNVLPVELLQPRSPNPNPGLNVYSTSWTPYACTFRDSVHMRRMLHLATLELVADRFVMSPFILSTFYFLLCTSYFLFYALWSLPCILSIEPLDRVATLMNTSTNQLTSEFCDKLD